MTQWPLLDFRLPLNKKIDQKYPGLIFLLVVAGVRNSVRVFFKWFYLVFKLVLIVLQKFAETELLKKEIGSGLTETKLIWKSNFDWLQTRPASTWFQIQLGDQEAVQIWSDAESSYRVRASHPAALGSNPGSVGLLSL